MKTELLKSAHDVVRHARGDRDAQLVYLLEAMADRIHQLEARLDRLSDATVGEGKLNAEDVISDTLEFERNVLSVIESNSYTVYTHIEAEIENKLEDLTESHAFAEAVEEAVKGSLVGTIEQVLEDTLHDAIVDAVGDAEDIVRKGLRAIL